MSLNFSGSWTCGCEESCYRNLQDEMDFREEMGEGQVGQRGAKSTGKNFNFQSLAWKQQNQGASKTLEDMENRCLTSMKWKVHSR